MVEHLEAIVKCLPVASAHYVSVHSFTHVLLHAGILGHHYRYTAGHRLKGRQSQSVLVAWQHKRVRAMQVWQWIA